MSENKPIDALWVGGEGDNKYLKGNIEVAGIKVQIIVFKNKYKDDEKKPDYRIFVSKPKEKSGEQSPF